jgi:hypothetical protein
MRLTQEATVSFWERMYAEYDRVTTGVPPDAKKKYRYKEEYALKVRTIITLWTQIKDQRATVPKP